jgi:hypothetical protein
VSFVSVTQQFNTTTSMGRLTLGMPKVPFEMGRLTLGMPKVPFEMGRLTLGMPKVPFEDEVWPKFLRENALKLLQLVE